MNLLLGAMVTSTVAVLAGAQIALSDPVALDSANSHYLSFHGKPTVLIGSTEHYGAVLNRAFDGTKYLDALKADGLNLTRTFSGVYREVPGSFGIEGNTLAPEPKDFVCPWPRSRTPGAKDGLNKFDLNAWDPEYFDRLRTFVRAAGERDIVVEFCLFCPFYDDTMWRVSPQNAANNVNGIGDLPRERVYTLDNGPLLEVQDRFVRKVVSELADADNVYYEICNEPYFGGVTLGWQKHVGKTIADAEAKLPRRHLVAQNIANGSAKIDDPVPQASIFNFHYANPPTAVTVNSALNRPIAYDETGFKGSDDAVYRVHGWQFLMAGGAIFDNLDYSFRPGHEAGDAPINAPGGGGKTFRRQMRVLRDFFDALDLANLSPAPAPSTPPGVTASILRQPGKQYALYLVRADANTSEAVSFNFDLPAGHYHGAWVDPVSGEQTPVDVDAGNDIPRLTTPPFHRDLALRLLSR